MVSPTQTGPTQSGRAALARRRPAVMGPFVIHRWPKPGAAVSDAAQKHIPFRTAPRHKPLMIPRYSRPEMEAIWTPETRFAIWLEIETLAMEALAEEGVIPASAAKAYRDKGKFEVARIDE